MLFRSVFSLRKKTRDDKNMEVEHMDETKCRVSALRETNEVSGLGQTSVDQAEVELACPRPPPDLLNHPPTGT